MTQIDLREAIESKEALLKRVFYVMVRKGYRRERGDVTYIPINDTLEIQLKLNIGDLIKDSVVCVFNDLLNRLELSKEEIMEAAFANTQEMFPARLESLFSILPIPIECDVPMYVLTNNTRTFGAGAILYSGMKEKIKSVIGEFIVIPSSVHEVILLPDYLAGPGIVDIIKDVNGTVVSDNEVLSNVPYKLTDDGKLYEV